MLQRAKVIKHTMEIAFTCEKCKKVVNIIIDKPSVYTGNYYDDWEYTYIFANCTSCNESNRLEI